jgi:hypothetical protein
MTSTSYGTGSLQNNEGPFNAALGWYSAYSNIDGSCNTAIGANALYYNTSGDYNTAVGTSALSTNVGGSNNTALGACALQCSEIANAGESNVAVGSLAGFGVAGGNYNTFLGADTSTSENDYNNSTALGYGAQITASNQIVLGTTSEIVRIPGSISYDSENFPLLVQYAQENTDVYEGQILNYDTVTGVQFNGTVYYKGDSVKLTYNNANAFFVNDYGYTIMVQVNATVTTDNPTSDGRRQLVICYGPPVAGLKPPDGTSFSLLTRASEASVSITDGRSPSLTTSACFALPPTQGIVAYYFNGSNSTNVNVANYKSYPPDYELTFITSISIAVLG